MALLIRLSILLLAFHLDLVFASPFHDDHHSPFHSHHVHRPSPRKVSRRSCRLPPPVNSTSPAPTSSPPAVSSSSCFPALDFKMPSDVPANTNGWWCDPSDEYAFLGFSYEVTACQSLSQLQREFADIRNNFNGRYVRLYGACDGREGFYDDVITAAWDNNLGVHALIWFGFDGSDQWKTRRDKLFATLHSNPKAKFVTRVVQFGSEPLFDGAVSPSELAAQVYSAKQALSDIDIPITVSELAYGYQIRGGAQDVLDAIDSINIHMLPFFARSASSGDQAWHLVQKDLGFFIENGKGKKMYFDENGWPSAQSASVRPQSGLAIASVNSEEGYFNLLDEHCADLKAVIGGGIGWFAHVYADDQEPGYGIYTASRKPKFPFAPKTYC